MLKIVRDCCQCGSARVCEPRGHIIDSNVRPFQLCFQLTVVLSCNKLWKIKVRTYGNRDLRKRVMLLLFHVRIEVKPIEVLVKYYRSVDKRFSITILDRSTSLGVGPRPANHP